MQHFNLNFLFSKKLTMQEEIAKVFIEKCQLTSAELSVLHGATREAPITDEFFDVVNRVQVKKLHL